MGWIRSKLNITIIMNLIMATVIIVLTKIMTMVIKITITIMNNYGDNAHIHLLKRKD